jgi:hypothetical protein
VHKNYASRPKKPSLPVLKFSVTRQKHTTQTILNFAANFLILNGSHVRYFLARRVLRTGLPAVQGKYTIIF